MSNTFSLDSSYALKLGDLGPPLVVQLLTSSNGANVMPFVLQAGDAVTLRYLDPNDAEHNVSMTFVPGQSTASYSWQSGDLPVASTKVYQGEIHHLRAGQDSPQTFPDAGVITWRVNPAIGDVEPPTTPYVNDNVAAISVLSPVYRTSQGHCDLAAADTQAHATCVGLAYAAIAPGESGPVISEGPIVAPTSAWDAITGQTGGLAPLAAYYVDPSTPGKLTVTPPAAPAASGKYSTLVGVAASSTMLDPDIQAPVQVGASLASVPGIFFTASQSNGIGQGNAASIGGGLIQPDPNIPMFQQSAPAGASPIWNVNYVGPLGPYAASAPNLGPELSMAKALAAAGVGVIIGKFGQSETNLAAQWSPTGTYPSGAPNNLFDQMIAYLDDMIAVTGASLRAFVWNQWESDAANNTMTAAYQANLFALMAAVRAHIGATVPIVIVAANSLVNPSLLPAQNVATIQAAQAAYVASDPHSALVYTSDLTSTEGGTVDYTAPDLVTIGNRQAAAILPFLGVTTPTVTRDSSSLRYLPATTAEWETLLAGLPGSPTPPEVIYNFQGNGNDATGVQNLTVGSGWTFAPPSGWTRYAATSADANSNAIHSSAGPIGDPYAASHLILVVALITGTPSATHDVTGCGGAAAYRGIAVTAAGKIQLIDLGSGNEPVGAMDYRDGLAHAFWLQVNHTGQVTQIVTDRETIVQSPYHAPASTSLLFTFGAAASTTAPLAIVAAAGWRGSAAEMSAATIAAIMARLNVGVQA